MALPPFWWTITSTAMEGNNGSSNDNKYPFSPHARISFDRLWEKSIPGSVSLPAAVAAMAGAAQSDQRETATG